MSENDTYAIDFDTTSQGGSTEVVLDSTVDNMPVEYESSNILKFEPSANDVVGNYTYKMKYYYAGTDDTTVFYELPDMHFIVI